MTPWHDDEIDAVKAMLRDGLTASQIADRISRQFDRLVSRNAVISIVARRRELAEIGFARQPTRARVKREEGFRAPAQARPARTSPQRPAVVFSPAFQPGRPKPPDLFKPGRAADIIVVPMSFLRALDEKRCLFFAADAMTIDGPDMPVCGCARHSPSAKPYCAAHLACEVAA